MNLPARFPDAPPRVLVRPRDAFTLPELLVTMTLFLLLVGGIMSAHLFGLRISGITEAKLNASGGARQAFGKMTDEIRKSTGVWVGNVTTNGNFVEQLDGMPQTGGALLIQPTTNAANFVVYFVNPSDSSFRRTTSAPGTTTLVAQSVTNVAVFRSQDFRGNVLTNSTGNRVFHVTLEFYQPQPSLPVPDYYKLETSVTRRALQ
jgi:prepilin-type N-terminal cleavage/methylation domain-containing protein